METSIELGERTSENHTERSMLKDALRVVGEQKKKKEKEKWSRNEKKKQESEETIETTSSGPQLILEGEHGPRML